MQSWSTRMDLGGDLVLLPSFLSNYLRLPPACRKVLPRRRKRMKVASSSCGRSFTSSQRLRLLSCMI